MAENGSNKLVVLIDADIATTSLTRGVVYCRVVGACPSLHSGQNVEL